MHRNRPTLYALSWVDRRCADDLHPRTNAAAIGQHLLCNLCGAISPASAQAFFASVATGMLALAGIVFSIGWVMVQFSSLAYSPRLVLLLIRFSSKTTKLLRCREMWRRATSRHHQPYESPWRTLAASAYAVCPTRITPTKMRISPTIRSGGKCSPKISTAARGTTTKTRANKGSTTLSSSCRNVMT